MSTTHQITIVIPAYNEERRIGAFLDEWLEIVSVEPGCYRILVVNDGSSDGTSELVKSFFQKSADIELLELPRNCGKGHAVRQGIATSSTEFVAFMDADGAYRPLKIKEQLQSFGEEVDAVIGTRELRDGLERKVGVTGLRRLVGRVFNGVVRLILGLPYRDTQCGFKIFRTSKILPLLGELRIDGFGFDVELVYLIHKYNWKVREVFVVSRNARGSKVHLVRNSVVMFMNVFQVLLLHGRAMKLLRRSV